jgi:hypothetical protein
MKKLLWIIGILIVLGFLSFLIADESIPRGERGPEAEALAEKMMKAVGAEAWKKIPYVAWSFRGEHHYVWDKKNHIAQVEWDDYTAVIDLNKISGKAEKGGKLLEGEEASKTIRKAWSYWCNDSFWLNAPVKAMDPGTIRKIVREEDEMPKLLVQYETGGVTPGDAYLWILDENYLPQAYKMWVSIIPVGGVKATWADWQDFQGAKIATSHKLGPLEIPVENVKIGTSPRDFDLPEDYFTSI